MTLPLFFTICIGFSYPENYPKETELIAFIRADQEIVNFEYGDLNNDSLEDCFLVLQPLQTIENVESRRTALVLIRNKSGYLELSATNENAVLCRDCGGVFGDPYDNAEITDRSLHISHYGGSSWRWSHNAFFSFNHDTKQMLLDSVTYLSYSVIDIPDSLEVAKQTPSEFGEIQFGNYDATNFFVSN